MQKQDGEKKTELKGKQKNRIKGIHNLILTHIRKEQATKAWMLEKFNKTKTERGKADNKVTVEPETLTNRGHVNTPRQ